MFTESKDDYLDEDPVIPDQRVAVLSILSPNTVNAAENLDWSIKGIKIRGVFKNEQEAQKRIDFLSSIDTYHHIFTAPVGKWCPWDDNEENVDNIRYGDEQLNQLMKKHKEHHDKSAAFDEERKMNARKNAIKHKKMMEKRRQKIEKALGKTSDQIVADEIIKNDIIAMQSLSIEDIKSRLERMENGNDDVDIENIINNKMSQLHEDKKEIIVNEAKTILSEKEKQINSQLETINKIEEEYKRVQMMLEQEKQK